MDLGPIFIVLSKMSLFYNPSIWGMKARYRHMAVRFSFTSAAVFMCERDTPYYIRMSHAEGNVEAVEREIQVLASQDTGNAG